MINLEYIMHICDEDKVHSCRYGAFTTRIPSAADRLRPEPCVSKGRSHPRRSSGPPHSCWQRRCWLRCMGFHHQELEAARAEKRKRHVRSSMPYTQYRTYRFASMIYSRAQAICIYLEIMDFPVQTPFKIYPHICSVCVLLQALNPSVRLESRP